MLPGAVQLLKRNVTIRDETNSAVDITLWGGYASKPGDQLEEVLSSRLADLC